MEKFTDYFINWLCDTILFGAIGLLVFVTLKSLWWLLCQI
jgi:hypothetical protein